jgi:hypothetical protein
MPARSDEPSPSGGQALLGFSGAVFVFHNVPAVAGAAADWIDLATPFAVIGASALLLRRGATALVLFIAVFGALLYVSGHGIHLAANSIDYERLTGDARDIAFFWDEEWGHIQWHLGWFVLIVGFCLAERERPVGVEPALGALSALLLATTLFTNTVEGGTWWLELAATAVLVPWALVARRPLLAAFAAAFALCAVAIGGWTAWHGGVPEFSDLGWL